MVGIQGTLAELTTKHIARRSMRSEHVEIQGHLAELTTVEAYCQKVDEERA